MMTPQHLRNILSFPALPPGIEHHELRSQKTYDQPFRFHARFCPKGPIRVRYVEVKGTENAQAQGNEAKRQYVTRASLLRSVYPSRLSSAIRPEYGKTHRGGDGRSKSRRHDRLLARIARDVVRYKQSRKSFWYTSTMPFCLALRPMLADDWLVRCCFRETLTKVALKHQSLAPCFAWRMGGRQGKPQRTSVQHGAWNKGVLFLLRFWQIGWFRNAKGIARNSSCH